MSRTVTVVAEFEVPDGVSDDDLQAFFEFELHYRADLRLDNPMANRDLPNAKSVDVRNW